MKPIDLSRLHSLRMANTEMGYTLAEMRPRFQRIQTRHEDGTAPQAVAAPQLFQTPPALAKELAGMLPQVQGMRVLEPSSGLGRLLDAVQYLNPSEVMAVECHADLCRELFRQDRAGVKLLQRNFLTIDQRPDQGGEEIGEFDAVIMNPPFTMRSDIRHILHALKFLKRGGTLAAICMDTHHREKILRPMASEWRKIPAGAFSKEGTGVACIMLTITK